jgi:hypothetical protein
MAHQNPVRVIDLGGWKFVSFVNHTLMVDKSIFKQDYEINNDIMFLARKKKKLRLFCLKLSPWIESKNFNDSLSGTGFSLLDTAGLSAQQIKDKELINQFRFGLQVYQTSGTLNLEEINDQLAKSQLSGEFDLT